MSAALTLPHATYFGSKLFHSPVILSCGRSVTGPSCTTTSTSHMPLCALAALTACRPSVMRIQALGSPSTSDLGAHNKGEEVCVCARVWRFCLHTQGGPEGGVGGVSTQPAWSAGHDWGLRPAAANLVLPREL